LEKRNELKNPWAHREVTRFVVLSRNICGYQGQWEELSDKSTELYLQEMFSLSRAEKIDSKLSWLFTDRHENFKIIIIIPKGSKVI
jgi:hypothetical protein